MEIRNNLLKYLKQKYSSDLCSIYPENEAKQILTILISHFFNISRTEMAANQGIRLSESEILTLHFAVKELKKNKPLQYVIGETEFYGLRMKVTPSVLIPRPETEEMVELICDREKEKGLSVLDIGTGSACIAIALEKNLVSATVTALDKSKQALDIAVENNKLNNSSVAFLLCDILNLENWNSLGMYDLIVSNPPYVTESDKHLMSENVMIYEPHEALFVPEKDELVFYKAILEFALIHLKVNGRIYLEINENKADEVRKLFHDKKFSSLEILKDFRGKDRFAIAQKPL